MAPCSYQTPYFVVNQVRLLHLEAVRKLVLSIAQANEDNYILISATRSIEQAVENVLGGEAHAQLALYTAPFPSIQHHCVERFN